MGVPPLVHELEMSSSRKADFLLPRCGACGLCDRCSSPKMPVWGEGRRKVLVVGEAPGEVENREGRPFVGKTGQHLRRALASLGVDMDRDCWVTNSIICWPWSWTKEEGKEKRKKNRPPSDKEIAWCQPNLLNALRELEPEVILLLGNAPVKSLIGWLWKEGPGGISKWAGWTIPCQRLNAWIAPTFHPSYLVREENPVLDRLWARHLEAAFSLSGRPWKEVPDHPSQVQRMLDVRVVADELGRLGCGSRPVAFDYEADRLKPDHPDAQIVCCSVSDGETTIAYPWVGEAIQATRDFLRSPVPKIAQNCFSGSTRFLTREHGVVSLRKMAGKRITVLNHEGRWVPASVESFGEQETVETTFSRRNYQNTVRSTLDHRWISDEDGSIIPTGRLRTSRYGKNKPSGPDRVPYLRAPRIIANEDDYVRGLQHGIILGDGSRESSGKTAFFVRLCQEKKVLLDCFDGHSRWYQKGHEGDPTVYMTRQYNDLKMVPSRDVSDSYLIGFFRGLVATDGCVDQAGQISITNSRDVLRWCRRYLPKVGYWFQGSHDRAKYEGRYEGGYNSTQDTWTSYLSRESVEENDLLRPTHLKKYKAVFLGPYKFSGLGDRRREEVFCAVVPDGESFTLNGGLVTGNCKFEHRWTLAKLGCRVRNWAFDTMVAAHVLDNRLGITSLKFQAFVLLGQESYDDRVKPFMKSSGGGNSPNKLPETVREGGLNGLLLYCGLDSLLEWKIAQIQAEKLGIQL